MTFISKIKIHYCDSIILRLGTMQFGYGDVVALFVAMLVCFGAHILNKRITVCKQTLSERFRRTYVNIASHE